MTLREDHERGRLQLKHELSVALRTAIDRALSVGVDPWTVAHALVLRAADLMEGQPCEPDLRRAATSASDDRPEGPVP